MFLNQHETFAKQPFLMNYFNVIIAIIAAISLFLFSLKGFSNELKELGAEKLNKWLSKVTENRFKGFLIGALITAIIQSSSAVSSITVALVDAGVMTFYKSLSLLIGANVGTTFTAWLVAFKIDNLGSILIVFGTLISAIPTKINLAGKSIFYLGLILFSLQQISATLSPLSHDENLLYWLSLSDNIFIGILVGALITAILQSSSVVTGLIIILAQQNLLSLDGAVAIVVGANIGTSSTALIASIKFEAAAKRAARANAFFNILGVLLFLPFLKYFASLIIQIQVDLPYQIAITHLFFNLAVAIIFLVFMPQFAKLFERIRL